MIDIVIPTDNEELLVSMAEKLGFQAVCFLYPLKAYKKAQLPLNANIKVYKGLLLKKAEKMDYSDVPFVVVEDNYIKLMRRYADGIVNIEFDKDYMHQRGSGLDHVMCREMAIQSIGYCISLCSLRKDTGKIMGRVMQNIKLCQKYKVPMMIASFASHPLELRSPVDMRSFVITLGMHSSAAKKAVEHAHAVCEDHTNPKRLKKGVYKV